MRVRSVERHVTPFLITPHGYHFCQPTGHDSAGPGSVGRLNTRDKVEAVVQKLATMCDAAMSDDAYNPQAMNLRIGLQLRCRAHNQYEARLWFGSDAEEVRESRPEYGYTLAFEAACSGTSSLHGYLSDRSKARGLARVEHPIRPGRSRVVFDSPG